MKIATFKPLFIATGLAMSTSALALPQFQVAGTNTFYATEINGGSSERLGKFGDGMIGGVDQLRTYAGQIGYMDFSGFTNAGPNGPFGTVAAIDSGLGVTYGLYLTFDLVADWNGDGTFGGFGSTYTLSSLNFSVYKDVGFGVAASRTLFTPATLLADADVTLDGEDVLLGSGSLVAGLADINLAGGTALNSATTYLNTMAGDAFFVDPSPFYTLAFNAFNNTGPGVQIGVDSIAISAAGVVNFNQVPEPATLALLGMGLVGMGVSLRKRKAA